MVTDSVSDFTSVNRGWLLKSAYLPFNSLIVYASHILVNEKERLALRPSSLINNFAYRSQGVLGRTTWKELEKSRKYLQFTQNT